ncbi:MAG: gamma-glutamyl-gamma-aminobutyrate hydrolase family protein, partial [Lachnospiraceae bacterium]|nr:gamma-glutamyl-gamma-aminobutyrate hydrolase family protein [Lachnospiraceae bacterium]
KDLFQDIPDLYKVTRYHSLVVEEKSLPSDLVITASTEDGVIMGLKHRLYPVYGIQFHPEAVLTEYGHELLQNFHRICQEWKEKDKENYDRRIAV